MLLSVYGTLKKGFLAHYKLGKTKLVHVGFHDIGFKMIDLGPYPALIKSKELHPIYLETYEISDETTLQEIDMYEGYPSLYLKETIKLSESIETTLYYLAPQRNSFCANKPIVESGCWIKNKNNYYA